MQSSTAIEKWNERFAIPGIATLVAGQGNLPKVRITAPAASAEIYLHGAHLTSWQPAGAEEVIFLSSQSRWEEGRAIRGGIPVCFPWFRAKADNPQAPAHGFARTTAWQVEALVQEQDSVTVTLTTESSDATRHWWPHDFRLVHRITVGSRLHLELMVTNTGSSSFTFEEALHTYFSVGAVEAIRVGGLNETAFLDNTDGNREKMQNGDLVMAGPTDNAYLNTATAPEIIDPTLRRRIRTEKKNSLTTVVWNPWKQGAASLADLGDDEWHRMACVEASNILGSAIALAPGEEHTMEATITVTTEENQTL
jgi:glucose-6-phosphate 1-epimerase